MNERYLKCTVVEGEGEEGEYRIDVDIHGIKKGELIDIVESLIKVLDKEVTRLENTIHRRS